MSFKEFPVEYAHKILTPRPIVIITTKNENNEINATSYSFVTPVSVNPSLIAISSSPNRETLRNIGRNQGFVINIVNEDIMRKIGLTGKKLTYGENELIKTELTENRGKFTDIPFIKDSIANFECIVTNIIDIGNHELVVGQVLNISVNEDLLNNGALDVVKAKPLLHFEGDNFAVVDNIKKID